MPLVLRISWRGLARFRPPPAAAGRTGVQVAEPVAQLRRPLVLFRADRLVELLDELRDQQLPVHGGSGSNGRLAAVVRCAVLCPLGQRRELRLERLVAGGATDAHIDVRSRLTPESFLAAAAILREAGGCVLDAQGNGLGEFEDLCHTTTIVATVTRTLAEEIVDVIGR